MYAIALRLYPEWAVEELAEFEQTVLDNVVCPQLSEDGNSGSNG
ncbi:MAG: hypothetical protein WBE26_03665 [Phycisphaerae bacterium]